jgi:hypothetical protein
MLKGNGAQTVRGCLYATIDGSAQRGIQNLGKQRGEPTKITRAVETKKGEAEPEGPTPPRTGGEK